MIDVAARQLTAACRRVLAAQGARVLISATAGNEMETAPAGEPGERSFLCAVEGLPNLLHEVLHVVQIGAVLRDHGTDPASLPFDLHSADGRRLWFQELACCTLSAAWFPGSRAAAREWFLEQVGIQHHFFGQETPAQFLAEAATVNDRFAVERKAVERAADNAFRTALRRVGATSLRPDHRFDGRALWKTSHSSASR